MNGLLLALLPSRSARRVLPMLCLAAGAGPLAAQRPQNVLVIIADDTGPDAYGCYGASASAPPTPNIDALAARGVRFTNAHSCPTCSPTRACIQTGRYPFRTGVGRALGPEDAGLDIDEWLLPEVLAGTQRQCGMFGKWHLGADLGGHTPNVEGWPWFAGTLEGELDDYFHFDLTINGTTGRRDAYATTDTATRALTWIQARTEPWLAMVCFNAGHAPLHEPPALLHGYALGGMDPANEEEDIWFFRAMVEAMDTEIGRLLAGIGPRVLADTTVIFVGDNGTEEAVMDPVNVGHAKGSLYERGIHVPLIVAGPAVLGLPRTCPALVDAVDLFPTIAALCGVDARAVVPASRPLDGRDLRPLLAGTASRVREWSFSERSVVGTYDDYAVRDERYKLIRFTNAAGVSEEFYDLSTDPDELDPLESGTRSIAAERAYVRLCVAIAQLREESYSASFGSGCAGAGGVPMLLAVSGAPVLGTVHLVRAAPIGTATLGGMGLLGFSMDSAFGSALPIDLGGYGLTGCLLHVAPDDSLPIVVGAAAASWHLPIPNSGSLLGVSFFQQMALVEPGANPVGLVFSNALANVIGS